MSQGRSGPVGSKRKSEAPRSDAEDEDEESHIAKWEGEEKSTQSPTLASG